MSISHRSITYWFHIMKAIVLFTLFVGVFSNPKYPDICGLENVPSEAERIINGKEAAMNQFPWLVAVTSGGLCTGSVLDEEWIITAKHCVNVGNTVWIKAGVHNRGHNLDNEPNMQIRESKEIYVSDKGDFALIKLPEPLELNDYVRPVCLPTRAHIDETFIGVNATLTGWGVNGYDHKYNYPELYYAKDIPVVKCPWPQEILCTSGKDSSVCFGDSGGPINYEFEAGKYMQIGVNQFVTSGQCLGGFNGYARFTTHLDFIQETTGIIFE